MCNSWMATRFGAKLSFPRFFSLFSSSCFLCFAGQLQGRAKVIVGSSSLGFCPASKTERDRDKDKERERERETARRTESLIASRATCHSIGHLSPSQRVLAMATRLCLGRHATKDNRRGYASECLGKMGVSLKEQASNKRCFSLLQE